MEVRSGFILLFKLLIGLVIVIFVGGFFLGKACSSEKEKTKPNDTTKTTSTKYNSLII